jgi:deoxyribodipyrimidine photo-lyase
VGGGGDGSGLAISTSVAKDRVYGVRKSSGFYAAADAVQEKHGNRKSGMPMTGQRKVGAGASKRKPRDLGAQLAFDLEPEG